MAGFLLSRPSQDPLLAIGEEKTINNLIFESSSGVMRRFHRIRLPGEPPEPEDPVAWAELA
jgi:hypothetical protein